MKMDPVAGVPPALLFVLCLGLNGCSLPQSRMDDTADLVTATLRVDQVINAANACLAAYVRRHDSPTITPGDVLDAALTECRPYFDAHRGAVHALLLAERQPRARRPAVALAHEEAERHAASFRRIVRETGLAVLVQRRSAASTLLPDAEAGEIHL